MRSFTAALVIALALGAFGPRAVDAQTIRGRVLDATTDEPIAGVTVRLMVTAIRPVVAAYSDVQGAFELDAPHGGNFFLQAERIGYPRVTTAPIVLLPGEVVEVTIRMDPRAILIAPLTVEVRTGGDRGREQFERRCALGTGICMDPLEVASIKAEYPSLLFRDVEGVVATGNGVIRRLGSRCMRTFINNEPVVITSHTPDYYLPRVGLSGSNNPARPSWLTRAMAISGGGGDPHANALDERIPRGAIRAIEIYLNFSDVPKEIRDSPRGWSLWPDWNASLVGQCGAIIIWTWDQW